MERTCHVQRLKPPRDGIPTDVFDNNPYINSGGVRNWGLSSESMTLLRGVMIFDLMGNAAFEWGAIEAGMKRIADHAQDGELIGFVIAIPLREVQRTFLEEDNEPPEGDGSVWVICRREDANEFSRRIRAWAANDSDRYGKHDEDPQWWLSEPTMLNTALRPHPVYPTDICGGFELDNGCFYFTNEVMYQKVCQLFGVNP